MAKLLDIHCKTVQLPEILVMFNKHYRLEDVEDEIVEFIRMIHEDLPKPEIQVLFPIDC